MRSLHCKGADAWLIFYKMVHLLFNPVEKRQMHEQIEKMPGN